MMLKRSFKPAKCKTALKLAVSRIKVLKNKNEGQLKQLKRELAELLESGHEGTARILVQHLVKEEKTMAAYELIQMFCEFIAACLPIIESQKICPTDLKEAISSVVFAAPRCAHIPELLDVKRHMTSKFGKEFISAATELRPECGVNRLLVEKLSLKPPDGPTKMKIMNAIAAEYDLKWEPSPIFGDLDAKSFHDLQKTSSCEESPHANAPPPVPGETEKGYPNSHAYYYSQHKEISDVATITNLYVRNASFAAENASGNGDRSLTTYRSFPENRSSGTGSGSQEMDCRYSYSGGGMRNWSKEFKDAVSAAEAAAESAERASMAARAAAELSNSEKIMRQYSTGSQQHSCFSFRDEFDKTYSSGQTNTASEFPVIHGNRSSIVQFSSEEAEEYGVHDAKRVSADSMNGNNISNTNNAPSEERPNHVHPKLPQYDSFAAHFLSLKFTKATQ